MKVTFWGYPYSFGWLVLVVPTCPVLQPKIKSKGYVSGLASEMTDVTHIIKMEDVIIMPKRTDYCVLSTVSSSLLLLVDSVG